MQGQQTQSHPCNDENVLMFCSVNLLLIYLGFGVGLCVLFSWFVRYEGKSGGWGWENREGSLFWLVERGPGIVRFAGVSLRQVSL